MQFEKMAPKRHKQPMKTPPRLNLSEQNLKALQLLKEDFLLSHSQYLQIRNWVTDCQMWGEPSFIIQMTDLAHRFKTQYPRWSTRQKRDKLFENIRSLYSDIASKEKKYLKQKDANRLPRYKSKTAELRGNIYRTCQAYSEKGVCCGLKVLNIVDNCAMDCAYCILQSHYEEPTITFPSNLKDKLSKIQIHPHQQLRVGPGEHSDALLWGNRNGMLDDLCDFARQHSNIILELKTKSANIDYFLTHAIPPNVCCSWTINSPTAVSNEEHKTATLPARLQAARRVADQGIKVAFHCHPMIFYKGWETEYQALIEKTIDLFTPSEVLWFSLGTITYVRELPKFLRSNFRRSKILQMDTEVTPDNKITYAEPIREKLYTTALKALSPWKEKVFIYLCMEFDNIWKKTLGYSYSNSDEFNDAINTHAFKKIQLSQKRP